MNRYVFFGILILFTGGCKDIYDPEIETNKTALVIQGLMTNIPGQLAVKLSRAVPYDSASSQIPERNAVVTVVDEFLNTIILNDNGFATYTHPTAICEPNKKYFLRVLTSDGNIYESSPQALPPRYVQDSIYAANIVKTSLVPDAYGDYNKIHITGIETYADISSESAIFPKCRYESKYTVLYTYVPPGVMFPPPPTHYCWKTFNLSGSINITVSKFDKTAGIAPKHNLGFFPTSINNYDERENTSISGWLLTINKYSLSTEVHQFYQKIKNQIEATGKLFDPVPSQIIGNLKCTNNPDKFVFGYFEVSYAEKLYYRYYTVNQNHLMLTPKDGFPGFSNDGELINNAPPFWNK